MTLPIVEDFQVTVPPGMLTLSWKPSVDVPASYKLYVAKDDSSAFSLLDTVLHDKGDPSVYNETTRRFYYEHAGEAGYVYKITAVYGSQESKPVFAVVVPDPDIVTVYGTVMNLDGRALSARDRIVTLQYVGGTFLDRAGATYVAAKPVTVTANDQGVWQARLLAGSRVRITIAAMEHVRTYEIPSTEGLYSLSVLQAVDDTQEASRNYDAP